MYVFKIKYRKCFIMKYIIIILKYGHSIIVIVIINVNIFYSSSLWTISIVSLSFLVESSVFDPNKKTRIMERQWKQEAALTYGKPLFLLASSFSVVTY